MKYTDEIEMALENKGIVYIYVNNQSIKVKELISEDDDTLVIKTSNSRHFINKSRIDYLKITQTRSGDMPTLG